MRNYRFVTSRVESRWPNASKASGVSEITLAIMRKAIADGSLCPPSCGEVQEYKQRRKNQIRKRPCAPGRHIIGKKVKR